MLTKSEVIRFTEENDVKFIRVAFLDVFGNMKNVSIRPSELNDAFERGVPVDAARIPGFGRAGENTVYLFPDPSTLAVLPWRPSSGRVIRLLSEIRTADGQPFSLDGRLVLKRQTDRLTAAGLALLISTQATFYLFGLDAEGNPTLTPQDKAGYLDVAPRDKGENIRREISFAMEDMGISPLSSFHEEGPGQNLIIFDDAVPQTAAENFFSYKLLVKAIAAKNGLFASFMPLPDACNAPNTVKVSLKISDNASPAAGEEELSAKVEKFASGVTARLAEIILFFAASATSYPIRKTIPLQVKGSEITLDFGDATMSSYYAFALLIAAGLEGLEKEAAHVNGEDALPVSLSQAASAAERSGFVTDALGDSAASAFIFAKTAEAREFEKTDSATQFINAKYFEEL